MLFIFRKLRRSFFLPGKVRTYLAYAIGEILLIVLGIMLAVQIGEWKQERRDHTEETQILLKLKPEFEFNQRNLEKIREIYLEVSEDMEAFSAIIQPEPQDYIESQVFKYLNSLRINRHFTPIYGELSSLLNSGKIGLISNEALGSQLNKWPRKIDDIDQMMELMTNTMDRYPHNFGNYRYKDVRHFAGRYAGVIFSQIWIKFFPIQPWKTWLKTKVFMQNYSLKISIFYYVTNKRSSNSLMLNSKGEV